MTKKLEQEIRWLVYDTKRFNEVYRSVQEVKDSIKEDHPFISKRTLNKAVKLYTKLAWN